MAHHNPENQAQNTLEEIRSKVGTEAERIATLGQWPDWMKSSAAESLTSRIPPAEKTAAGFDAGIACALNLIPNDKQALSASLHAAYTPEKIAQVRKELEHLDPEDETAWWLAACKICGDEKPVNEAEFLDQVDSFRHLSENPADRLKAALSEYVNKMTTFETQTYGAPFGKIDGCMQAAYLAGYPFATMFSDNYGIYFIGTPNESLGLEDFKWSDQKDEGGRAKSGPVFGSKQFVKCANEEEFKRALEIIKSKLPVSEDKKA